MVSSIAVVFSFTDVPAIATGSFAMPGPLLGAAAAAVVAAYLVVSLRRRAPIRIRSFEIPIVRGGLLAAQLILPLVQLVIGGAIVWSAVYAFIGMAGKGYASIDDILLLFISLELGAMVTLAQLVASSEVDVARPILAGVAAFFALLALLVAELKRKSTRYVITDNKIIRVDGILSKRTSMVPYTQLERVDVTQSLLQRILQIGTVVVDTVPSEIAGYADVVLPEAMYLERYDTLNEDCLRVPFIALRQPAVHGLVPGAGSPSGAGRVQGADRHPAGGVPLLWRAGPRPAPATGRLPGHAPPEDVAASPPPAAPRRPPSPSRPSPSHRDSI